MFKCKTSGPNTIQNICEDESVEVKDPGGSKVFNVKGKELRVLTEFLKKKGIHQWKQQVALRKRVLAKFWKKKGSHQWN